MCYLYTDDVLNWINRGVATAVASALADSTQTHYKGAGEIFLLFCLFMQGAVQFLPVSDKLLCQYLWWRSFADSGS